MRGIKSNGPVEIAPSILAADFTRLGEQIAELKAAGCQLLHIDVMDGHFVPNLTIGLPVVRSLRRATDLALDCHLMISEPDRYVEAFAEAGADMISVHQEAAPHLDRTLAAIRAAGARAGVALNPATPVVLLSEVLPQVDYVLVMSVNPGFAGQQFLPGALAKLRQLADWRADRRLHFCLEVDGGIGVETIGEAVRAGADLVVVATSIFHAPNPRQSFEQLRQLAWSAVAEKV
ncbi:MAG: ribulose-phosphate 3-epimerase [Acidobacteria bacterium]|nr:ribulose-phosphate 3-epimerase [Acidobacteriota bacterium]